MRKREVAIDLTALLDVILILFFSVLLLNTEQIARQRLSAEEADEQRAAAERELAGAMEALGETMERLEALREWDTERLGLLDEAKAQGVWRAAVEGAFVVARMGVSAAEGRRLLGIEGREAGESVEIFWGAGNAIQNREYVENAVTAALGAMLDAAPGETPMLVMLDDAGIAWQEFGLVYGAVRRFAESRPERSVHVSVYTGWD